MPQHFYKINIILLVLEHCSLINTTIVTVEYFTLSKRCMTNRHTHILHHNYCKYEARPRTCGGEVGVLGANIDVSIVKARLAVGSLYCVRLIPKALKLAEELFHRWSGLLVWCRIEVMVRSVSDLRMFAVGSVSSMVFL